jgi:hypothetical protein
METISPQNFPKFFCEKCQMQTNNKKDFSRHLLTAKHCGQSQVNNLLTKKPQKTPDDNCKFLCPNCNKHYKSRVGLWKHAKICDFTDTTNPVAESIDELYANKDLIMMLVKQNAEMMEILKNGTNNTINNTNCNNKTFNLQVFLNETCKDAMNIMDFIDSIKLQLSDLERIGEVGYIEGISNIITSNLKALDVKMRPVHCTDKKRETIYIKDENKWTKEDDNRSRLRTAIKKVANKNIKLLPQYREKHPDYGNADSKLSDKYCKMVIEAMGGAGKNDAEKEDKIISKISKNIVLEK